MIAAISIGGIAIIIALLVVAGLVYWAGTELKKAIPGPFGVVAYVILTLLAVLIAIDAILRPFGERILAL